VKRIDMGCVDHNKAIRLAQKGQMFPPSVAGTTAPAQENVSESFWVSSMCGRRSRMEEFSLMD